MKPQPVDSVELAIFQSTMHSIAEEMGAALRRTALSPNIKERRDYSCAVFDGQCRVIAGSSAHLVILVGASDSGNNEVSSGGLSGTPPWDSTH